MAKTKEKRVFIDVWILETNTVYREVPYTVVADWVQQGRLLEDDKIRPSGTAEWVTLGGSPAFAAYLPRAEPFRPDDQAEVLEPVQIDFAWKAPRDEGDDDIDMIPLIDVSLVLLIFFMMTATVASSTSFINVPWAANAVRVINDPKRFGSASRKSRTGCTIRWARPKRIQSLRIATSARNKFWPVSINGSRMKARPTSASRRTVVSPTTSCKG